MKYSEGVMTNVSKASANSRLQSDMIMKRKFIKLFNIIGLCKICDIVINIGIR